MNIQNIIIVEQARNLREFAEVTHEQMAGIVPNLGISDFVRFENNELYSKDVVEGLYLSYLISIETIYINKDKPFIKMLKDYCNKYEINFGALCDRFYRTQAETIVENCSKDGLINALKSSMRSAVEYHSLLADVINNTESSASEMKASQTKLLESYEDARDAWHKNREKAEILIEIISADDELKNKIIPLINEQMELEREDDFADKTEESYLTTINELETYWDFISDK